MILGSYVELAYFILHQPTWQTGLSKLYAVDKGKKRLLTPKQAGCKM